VTGFVEIIVLKDRAHFQNKTAGEKDITLKNCNAKENLWEYLQLVKNMGGAIFTPTINCEIMPKGKQESIGKYDNINNKEDKCVPGEGHDIRKPIEGGLNNKVGRLL
jgi:hypothetical protein